MKIAAYIIQGRTRAGIVAPDLQSILPIEMSPEDEAFGALRVVEQLSAKDAVPRTGAPVALGSVRLIAPLPRPRRNIFCRQELPRACEGIRGERFRFQREGRRRDSAASDHLHEGARMRDGPHG